MSAALIKASAGAALDALPSRLIEKAAALATAHGRTRLLARRQDERRWRRAGLLWPLFAKG
jgi:hypothetical protein